MDEDQMKKAQERLLQMRREILQEVQDSFHASRELGQDGVPDIGDMSANTYHRDVLFNLGEAQKRMIRDIDAALDRLAKGEYGVCARCGDDISPRRMEVRPFSRYCIDCKSEIEQFGE